MFGKSNEVPLSAVLYRRGCAFGLPLISNRASGSPFRLLVALLLGARQEPEIPVPPSCRSMLPFWHKGFAPHFPLPAALPARPHACGHADIARCSLQRLRRPVRTMGFRPPRFSIVAAAPSAYLSFRTAPLGRRFGCWLRSSAALSRNLRFLYLPLAAPCRSLSSRGLAFRFPLLAALPARPHACGHANIARYSLQRLRRPVRTMGLRPIPWQEPEVPAPPSCRSMLPLLPPFRLF